MRALTKICGVGLTVLALLSGGVGMALAGSIVAWGDNTYGVVSHAPTFTDFVRVAGSSYGALALRSNGSIVAWGDDSSFQVTDTPTGTGFKAVAGDGVINLALRSDGSIDVWGYDYWSGTPYSMITGAPMGTGFTAIDGNSNSGIALHSDGSLAVWGDDGQAQVSGAPTGTGFTAVATNGYGCLALGPLGRIYGWGFVPFYQPTGTGFVAIALNWASTALAMRSDGSIVVWGYNGQYTVTTIVKGKNVVTTYYHPSLISLAPKGTGFTSLGGSGLEYGPDVVQGVGLAIHGP